MEFKVLLVNRNLKESIRIKTIKAKNREKVFGELLKQYDFSNFNIFDETEFKKLKEIINKEK